MNMIDNVKRDSTHTSIHVFDGYEGREMLVEATLEGLEFEDCSTIEWEWIDSAREIVNLPKSDESWRQFCKVKH